MRKKKEKKSAVKKRKVIRSKRKPKHVKRKRVSVTAKRKSVKKRRPVRNRRRVVRQTQRMSLVRVVSGKKVKRTRRKKRRVIMAGRRRRAVGKKGGSGLLIGLGIGALAIYLMSRPKTQTYPTYPQLPPLTQTQNYQRNDQTSSILNYALAAGLAVNAITALIDKLNNSDDQQIKNIYDHVETTGSIPDYVYV